MKDEDKKKFRENVTWFNQFFEGIHQLFEKIEQDLPVEGDQPNKLLYYPKTNFKPTIPEYYMIGLGYQDFAIQVFAILDPSLFSNQGVFEPELSLIIVKHSQGKYYGSSTKVDR